MKTIPDLSNAVLELEKRRTSMGREIGTVRVDLAHLEQMRQEAKSGHFSLVVDEPAERGGTDMGLHPLGYFIVGAASCFTTQFARNVIIKSAKIDTIEMTARAHYDRGKLRRFTEIIYDLRVTGRESKENTIQLLYDSENTCFVHQTLKDTLPLTTNLSLNGVQITTHTLGPEQ